MIKGWATALLIGAAVPANAACPNADDLGQGVVLIDRREGAQQIAFASVDLGEGLYWQGWQSTVFPDGWQIYKYQGLFELAAVRNSGKHLKEVTYDRALADVFPLKVGARHSYGFRTTNDGTKNLDVVPVLAGNDDLVASHIIAQVAVLNGSVE